MTGPTIQALLEKAAATILQEPIKLNGSGRTDAGVHALGQAANFKTSSKLPPENILRGMNSLLPCDIAVREAEDVGEGFHARFDALSKRYQYRIHNGRVRSPLVHNRAWHIPAPIDLNAMNAGAAFLQGTHDFSAFRSSGSDVESSLRIVSRAECVRRGEMIFFDIEADGFLRHMVRALVGTLVEVGRGKREAGEFPSILESRNRKQAGMTAPPQGLFLMEVRYQ